MRKNIFNTMRRFFLLSISLLLLFSCKKQESSDTPSTPARDQKYYTNLFAYNVMNPYYLWRDDVMSELEDWDTSMDPIAKVKSLRYKEGDKLVDRWTELMDDYTPFQSSVTGNGKTFGLDFVLLRVKDSDDVVMEIIFTYADSPARKAGLKRGDIVRTVDGTALNMSNYVELLNEKIYYFPETLTLGLMDGNSVSMTAVKMYSNPVHIAKTLDVKGKKVGYLHFTDFTLDACKDLVDVFRQFKADGIQELVLDLRYNRGGYVTTSQVLASMIAPPSVVQQKSIFCKDIFNSLIGPDMDTETPFAPTMELTLSSGKIMLNMLNANPGIERLWVLVTGSSASASELIICGLKPYLDVRLVGSQTLGKFCGGYLVTAENWFKQLQKQKTDIDFDEAFKYTEKWGLYVIASRYTDCNGVTLSMPDGIPVDYEAYDNPRDGYDLGDPSEAMLAVALGHMNGLPVAMPTKSVIERTEVPFNKPGAGVLLY
jgi:C-terminal processing protease CtpA/Prc